MINKIRQWLGVEERTSYTKRYFYQNNMRSSVYMSIVVLVLEVFLIYDKYKRLGENINGKSIKYFWDNYQSFIIPFAAAFIMFVIGMIYAFGVKVPRFWGTLCIWVFASACIYFGMKTSYDDFSNGEQILTFLTMEIFVMCLLTWRPIVGFIILVSTYGLFIYSLNGMEKISRNTTINMFIMWFATVLFCISNYHKTIMQCIKDEQMENVNRYLTKVSVRDNLTGISNVNYFSNAADKMLADSNIVRSGKLFLFFDIANFKSYNNKFGYEKGNELLKAFAGKLITEFSGDLTARFSDDHFVVFTSRGDLRVKVLKLRADLLQMGEGVNLELKCGAYCPEEEGIDAMVACDRARYACNSIKKRYGEFYYEYDSKLAEKSRIQQYVVNNIDAALGADFIKVYYQPVVSTATGGLCGLEALARWQDPEYGLLQPGMFIETLEEYRQIHKIDMRVVETVCRDLRAAIDRGDPVVPVSLNFSRLDFELCDITGHLKAMAKKYRVPRAYLDVEITESALTDEGDLLKNRMTILRNEGHNLWLDDFGSGYSSLNVLKDYSFDVLKIDMLFLKGFETNETTKTIIKVVVDMTKQLGITSLCEGVETREQYDFLASIGCNRTQGYYFSKPVPEEKIREMIREGKLSISPEFLEAPKGDFAEEDEKNNTGVKGMDREMLEKTVNKQLVTAMIRDINRGKSIPEIAKRHNIPVPLSEMICRLYLTHPGVDEDGIMSKLGL